MEKQLLDGIVALSLRLLTNGEGYDPFLDQGFCSRDVIEAKNADDSRLSQFLDSFACTLHTRRSQVETVDLGLRFQTGEGSLIGLLVVIKAFDDVDYGMRHPALRQPLQEAPDALLMPLDVE